MKSNFTIGEVSKLFDMNVRTLRYYDSIGLLRPEEVDGETGYRYYSFKQFEALNTIKYLRTLHVPLEKIAAFLQGKDADAMLKLLTSQKEEIEKQRETLERISKKLEGRLTQVEDAMNGPLHLVEEHILPQRKVAVLRKEIPLGGDLEYPIRELERLHGLEPIMFLGKVGVSVSKEALLRGHFTEFCSIFVRIEPADRYTGQAELLPGGPYLTLRFQGTHRGSAPHYGTMLRYMKEHGYTLAGDSLEIALIDSGMTSEPEQFVTELQLPIKKA